MARSLLERLQALEQSVGRKPSNLPAGESGHDFVSESTEPSREQHPLFALGFQQCEEAGATCWVRIVRYDLLALHGDTRFSDMWDADLKGIFRAARLAETEIHQLRFYDTETTGLGTGAGNIPFLHAVAQVEDDEFVVYQYFLDDYSEELALLNRLLVKHFATDCTVVTFNGKSFDWPLFRNRLQLYRQACPDLPQLDLLYPSRRLWKASLPKVSLSVVEEHILGLVRRDDLPGKEAPNRYFAYIDSKDAQLIAPVLDHNANDVCSLAALVTVLSNTLSGQRPLQYSSEHVAVGRYYDEWQEYDLAEKCYIAALSCPDSDWKGHWVYTLHLKRRQSWDEAASVWTTMTERFTWTVQPAVELAKHYEHRVRNFSAARTWAKLALDRCVANLRMEVHHRASAEVNGFITDHPVVIALRHRIERIEKKAGE